MHTNFGFCHIKTKHIAIVSIQKKGHTGSGLGCPEFKKIYIYYLSVYLHISMSIYDSIYSYIYIKLGT